MTVTDIAGLPVEDPKQVEFPCMMIEQPVGSFYIGVMPWKTLLDIAYFDVRRIVRERRDVETYLGIQRELRNDRVEELKQYVNFKDASFPTGIVIAVEADCAAYDEQRKIMTLMNNMDTEIPGERVFFRDIARVIDGQHRIAGLEGFAGERFDLPVVVLIGMDIADQAYIFSTVNLAQTKVNPSLAYDLYELAQARSPQKTCHNIAVALDQHQKSPFYLKIKRLGVATEGRFNETLTQATFIKSLMPYISRAPLHDRDILLRGGQLSKATNREIRTLIFRNMFVDEDDLKIMDVVWNYFEAIKNKWPKGWGEMVPGNMLNRTNGFRGFMRFLRPAYLHVSSLGNVPSTVKFSEVFEKTSLRDDDFTVDRFQPGSSGEALLFQTLLDNTGIDAE
jgi:DGQHR domain-containing protein